MNKSILIVLVCGVIALTGSGSEAEVGYRPPIAIPIRISINTSGEVKIGVTGDVVTPAGTFDLSFGADVRSIRDQYQQKVLIVRVDDDAVVYRLEEGKEFKVNFDDSNKLYRKVALVYESDGDIVLELESAQQPAGIVEISESSSRSASAAPASSRDPEEFVRDYFHAVTHQRNYEYTWTLLTDDFRDRNTQNGYSEYVQFWDTVDQVKLRSIDLYDESSTAVKCHIDMVLVINGKDYPIDARYQLIFDSANQTWMFD